jgi:hypothetical protein
MLPGATNLNHFCDGSAPRFVDADVYRDGPNDVYEACEGLPSEYKRLDDIKEARWRIRSLREVYPAKPWVRKACAGRWRRVAASRACFDLLRHLRPGRQGKCSSQRCDALSRPGELAQDIRRQVRAFANEEGGRRG